MLLIAGSAIALAGSNAVNIREQEDRYHFLPDDVTVGVGTTVTWTNDSDAPHTVTSDTAGGPLDSPTLNQNDTYQETFSSVGDFAYHCNIHDYMHGTVHVTGLDPTDSTGTAAAGTSGNGTLIALAGAGSIVVLFGLGLRLRRRADEA
jgi:plastocyanin